jgi:hypothetical protein
VLFDLPLDPDLLEQRIGRLDRIGQTRTVEIHVPYLAGTAARPCIAGMPKVWMPSRELPVGAGRVRALGRAGLLHALAASR